MRVLVIEDDPKIASFVVKGLKESGFAVDRCEDGASAWAVARSTPYDALVVDVMLPEMDGLALVKGLRKEGVDVPVLFLSAKASVENRVAGLYAGGDDYLTKPFSFTELLARIQALIRRSTQVVEATELEAGGVRMNLVTREVTRGDKKLELQSKEFALLEYFLRNPNRPIAKTMILERIWDYSFDPQTNIVDVLVHRLRTKVDKDFDRKLIQTVRGVGYVFKVD